MIRSGRTVFQGAVDDLRAAQRSELVMRPENPELLGALAQLIADRGLHVGMDQASSSVIVLDAGSRAGELNRAALEGDVTISHLAQRQRSLEEAYFALTGTHSGDVEERGDLGGIR
jgi:ABC-type multidrug transport system ATPase subunit